MLVEHLTPVEVVSLNQKKEILVNYFREHASVLDRKKGYISAPWVNLEVDTLLLGYASDLVVEHFKNRSINIVAGIPMCGIPLATAVAERMGAERIKGAKLIVPRKGPVYPANFGKEIVITESTTSFTTGEKGVSFVFPSLIRKLAQQNKGRLLLVDDFCALGDTACVIIPTLRNLGLEVLYATYVSKKFQGGLERIRRLGIEAFSVIVIESITPEDKLIITA